MTRKERQHRFLYLLRYARPHWRLVVAQFALMGIAVSIGVLKPWPLKILVDNVVGALPLKLAGWSPPWEPSLVLLLACIAYLVLHVGDSVVAFGSSTVATLSSARMVRDLRAHLLHSLQGLSLKFHDAHRVGDLVHRVTYNTSAVETAFQSGFMGAIKSFLTLCSIFCIMLAMNRPLTFVALAVVPLLLLTIRLYARHIQRASLRHQNQEGTISSRLQEILSSIRLVQAFGREPWEQERFDNLSHLSIATRLKTAIVQSLFGLSTAAILAMGTALLFWVGIGQVLKGQLTIGEFLVFNAYLTMLYAPLSVLSYTASSVQSALGGGSRLFEILDAANGVEENPHSKSLPTVKGAIAYQNVFFGYDDNRPVLHGVDFAINPGEIVALVGETGSGKSTILSLLLRFYKPQTGKILIDGVDIENLPLPSLRGCMGLVPQDSLLFSDSIRENIAYGLPSAPNSKIEWAAEMAEASSFIAELPDGYETLVGERGIRLSVGQRQRIALARAFLRCSALDAARILLLDEPTSALDAQTEARLMANLETLARNRTILIVTHRLSTIQRAERIIVLDKGRTVENGSHEELLGLNGYYAKLFQAQNQNPEASAPVTLR